MCPTCGGDEAGCSCPADGHPRSDGASRPVPSPMTPAGWAGEAPGPAAAATVRRTRLFNVAAGGAAFVALTGVVAVITVGGRTAAPTSRAVPTSGATSGAPGGAVGEARTFADAAKHFSIAVPSTWRSIDPSSPGAIDAFKTLLAANPRLAEAYGSLSTATLSSAMSFFGISADSTAPGSVNVVAVPALGVSDSDLSSVELKFQAEYQRIGATVAQASTISLAGHQALHNVISAPLVAPGAATSTVTESQDVVLANDLAYILTSSGSSPDLDGIIASFSLT